MSPHSAEYERFLLSIDEPVGRGNVDTFDRRALLSLTGADKTAAEDLLISKLPAVNDARVARALVDLGARRAVPALRAALDHASNDLTRVAIARALKDIDDDRSGLGAVIEVLRSADGWSSRSAAAIALMGFPGRESELALLVAFEDPERTVRLNAFEALLSLRGLKHLTSSYLDALGMMTARLGSELAAIRNEAILEVKATLDALSGGRSPAELGLDYVAPEDAPWCARLVDSLSDDNESLALDALDQTKGRDRMWAEDLIMSRLPDPRMSRALGHIRSQRAIQPLQEIQASSGGVEAEEAGRALQQILGGRQA